MDIKREKEVLLQLLAGLNEQGRPVLEKVEAYALSENGVFELIHSPLFIRNLAAGDIFRVSDQQPGKFKVLRRSGNLSVRVFRKQGIDELATELTPEVEKLGGTLDRSAEMALVYSLHVNIGFSAIETLMDRFMGQYPGMVWYFGNVYDPADGVTPLNWWDEFVNQI